MIYRLLLIFYLLGASLSSVAQCDNYTNPGNRVLSAANVCAPVDFMWEIEYSVLEVGVIEIYVDWDDGTSSQAVASPSGLFRYRVVLNHTYPKGGNQCNYEPKAYLSVNGTVCTSSIQTQTVTVWDTDDENGGVIQPEPQTYRLCLGQGATLRFEDQSLFNCVPASGENDRINQLNRWVQWEYGVGDGAQRIPAVKVLGDSSFPKTGGVEYRPSPVQNPWSVSDPVEVPPVNDPAMVGREFVVTLKNWNHCNPYDQDLTDGDPLNPATAAGDNTPRTQQARVVIVDSPEADFSTHQGSRTGAEETVFCVGEQVYFNNLSSGSAGSDLSYTWAFYNDDAGTELIGQKSARHPRQVYDQPGRKLVTLEVRDRNSVGNCHESYYTYIDIISIGEAVVLPPVSEICLQEGDTAVTFQNVSAVGDTTLSRWQWQVIDALDRIVLVDSGSGFAPDLAIRLDSVGTYRAVLSLRQQGRRCVSHDTAQVRVLKAVQARFSAENICQGDTLRLTSDVPTSQVDNYLWDIDGDGLYEYSGPMLELEGYPTDTLTIRHRIQQGGCYSDTVGQVVIYPQPAATLTQRVASESCDQIRYQFSASSQSDLSYHWTFSQEPRYTTAMDKADLEATFNKTGQVQQISLILRVRDEVTTCWSVADTIKFTVPARELPQARMRVYPTIMTVENPVVTVENLVESNPAYSYRWDFGDGTTSQEYEPGSHVYQHPGTYVARLIVSNDFCRAEDSIYVRVNQVLPQIDYEYSYVDPCNPHIVVFENQSQYADSATFRWDFGDGTTSYAVNPTHVYLEPGTYRVRLSGSNSLGSFVYDEQEVVVAVDRGPAALFEIEQQDRYFINEPIVFTNQSQGFETLNWDFGDSTYTSEEEPIHLYDQPGSYRIKLTVADSLGCVDSLVHQIQVEPPLPEADFSLNPTEGCGPLTVSFTNLSQNAERYFWTFGFNQGVSNQESPVYTYYQAGTFTVTLVAYNAIGASDTATQAFSVDVFESPKALFRHRPEEVFLGDAVYFSNNSLHATRYRWDFGDGSISTEFEPQHTYTEPGSYNVQLIAENDRGCIDTLIVSQTVVVLSGGKVNVPNAFSPRRRDDDGGTPQGDNDVFRPVFEGVLRYHLMIYNRWGELLFESHDKRRGWDGYYKGKLQPRGVYVYRLEVTLSDGTQKSIIGDLTLVR